MLAVINTQNWYSGQLYFFFTNLESKNGEEPAILFGMGDFISVGV
jgi:hypothetical protein